MKAGDIYADIDFINVWRISGVNEFGARVECIFHDFKSRIGEKNYFSISLIKSMVEISKIENKHGFLIKILEENLNENN